MPMEPGKPYAIERSHQLYKERMRLQNLTDRLELEDLKRLNDILHRMTPEMLKEAAGFAEGLAMWAIPEQESPDGPKSEPGSERIPAG